MKVDEDCVKRARRLPTEELDISTQEIERGRTDFAN